MTTVEINIIESLYSLHLVGIVLGVFATLYIDFLISKLCRKGRVSKRMYLRFRLMNKISIFGALLIWSSLLVGFSLPELATSQAILSEQLWAGVTILCFLSVNLYLIRKHALPRAKRLLGLSIYGGLSDGEHDQMLGIGALSSVSWVALLLLWMLDAGYLPIAVAATYETLMIGYLIAMSLALVFGKFGGRLARARFFSKLESKRSKYRSLVRTYARRSVVRARMVDTQLDTQM